MKKYILFVSAFIILLAVSCTKNDVDGTEIYPDADPALVEFLPDRPIPNIASEGEIVRIAVEGLNSKTFTAYMSSIEAEVVEVSNSYITIKIPQSAITGSVSVMVDGQLYFGPTIRVRGDVSIDPNFDAANYSATNGYINGIVARDATTYILYGNFQGYQGRQTEAAPINGIVIINNNGDYASTTTIDNFSRFLPRYSNITDMFKKTGGGYIISGGFSIYGDKDAEDGEKPVNGIVSVNATGYLDTIEVDVVNPDPVNNPDAGTEIVSALNGGVSGSARRVFETTSNQYIVTGNFSHHVSTFYPMSQKGAPFIDRVEAPSIFKMNTDGVFDSSYNYDYALEKGSGVNGFVLDAVKLPNNDVIMVGNFTGFQGQTVGRIVKVDAANGKVSSSFNAGTGADGEILRITRNPNVANRYVISGTFRHYNGVLANGVAVIDGTGNLITTFAAAEFAGGVVNYAGMLSNGNVIVSGTFTHYNGKPRPGLAILSSSGQLINNYNKFGLFSGQINDMAETTSNGLPAVILVGNFNRFDNTVVGNIVKLIFTN
ncbi:MAG: hypothetical protein ACK5NK_09755 [Niabella sp.]